MPADTPSARFTQTPAPVQAPVLQALAQEDELPQVAEQPLPAEQVPGYMPWCVVSTQQAAVLQPDKPEQALVAQPVRTAVALAHCVRQFVLLLHVPPEQDVV